MKELEKSLIDNISQSTNNNFSTRIEEINNNIKQLKEDFKINAQFLVSYDKSNYLDVKFIYKYIDSR